MQKVVEYELHDHGAIPWRAVSLNPAQSAVQAHKLPPYLCEWCIAYAHGAPHLLRKVGPVWTHRALRCCGHSCTNSASTMNSFVQCHSRRIRRRPRRCTPARLRNVRSLGLPVGQRFEFDCTESKRNLGSGSENDCKQPNLVQEVKVTANRQIWLYGVKMTANRQIWL